MESAALEVEPPTDPITLKCMTPAELVERRQVLHLSQINLARALGVAANTVNRWEAGTRSIPSYLGLALDGVVHRAHCGGQAAAEQAGDRAEALRIYAANTCATSSSTWLSRYRQDHT